MEFGAGAGEPEGKERCGDLNLEKKIILKWVLKIGIRQVNRIQAVQVT